MTSVRAAIIGAVIGVAALLTMPAGALAVIPLDLDISMLGRNCGQALVGKIVKVDGNLIQVEITKDFKKGAFDKDMRVDVSAVADVASRTRAGQPIVLFVAKVKGALVHFGDTLCVVEDKAAGSPPTWKVTSKEDFWKTFPGSTTGLLACLEDIYSKGGMLQTSFIRHRMGYASRELADLKAKPLAAANADVDGNKVLDLLVCTEGGVRLLLTTREGPVVGTTDPGFDKLTFKEGADQWGLGGIKAHVAAFGDVNADGKPDLLLDGVLMLNRGAKFEKSAAVADADGADLIATAIADANGDGRPDALMLTRSGQLRIYANSGDIGKPWPLTKRDLWTAESVKATKPQTIAGVEVSDTPSATALGAVFDKWGGDDLTYVMVVRADGIFRYPLDPTNGLPADLPRLCGATGSKVNVSNTIKLTNLACVVGVRLDPVKVGVSFYACMNPYPDFALVNRRYGCFMPNNKIGDGWRGGKGSSKVQPTVMCAGDWNRDDGFEEVIAITANGKVYEQDNDNNFGKAGTAGKKTN